MHQGREGRSWPVYFGRETSAFSRSLSALSLLPQRRSINHVRRQSRQPQEQQRLLGRSAAREQLEQLPAQHSTPSLRRLNTIRVRGNGLLACYRDHEATAALRVPVLPPASLCQPSAAGGLRRSQAGPPWAFALCLHLAAGAGGTSRGGPRRHCGWLRTCPSACISKESGGAGRV